MNNMDYNGNAENNTNSTDSYYNGQTSNQASVQYADESLGEDKFFAMRNIAKAFIWPLCIGIGLVLGISGYQVMTANTFAHNKQVKVAVVDINQLIRQASMSFAQQPNTDPEWLNRKITMFKNELIEALNQFALKQDMPIYAASQVFGNVEDKTQEFTAYLSQENGQ